MIVQPSMEAFEGESCQWQFGNEPSLANLFAKMKFRVN
jgi:hypothetical protein